ncbi:MAG: hypothetical protein BGO14_05160 [Chlamydiales bacterium 38-26]|nr:hypothetical protein [Chlamydiales bacterium]OJV07864.1 MAG: hypothetical protein BGO14_05160 [Chlamydiales bacterium 38-26]
MFRNLGTILVTSLTFFCLSLFAEDNKVELPLEVIARASHNQALSLNDHDEVLITFHETSGSKYAIWSPKKNLELIADPKKGPYDYYNYTKLGNNGMVTGNKRDISYNSIPIIWSHSLGLQELNIAKDISDDGAQEFTLVDVNSFGQIIGSYKTKAGYTRAFIWERGRARKLSIDNDLERLGYTAINIKVHAINDKGALLGSFESGIKHPLKDGWVVKKTIYFLWDGNTHIIDLFSVTNVRVSDLNNNNQVLLSTFDEYDRGGSTQMYLWSVEKGLRAGSYIGR